MHNSIELELEQERVRLAGCLVAAGGGAHGPNDCHDGDYGWSPAFEEVKTLRLKYDEAVAELKKR